MVLIQKFKSPPEDYYCNFINPFGNILFPKLTAECLTPVLYFSAEYQCSGQNIKVLFCKYFVDIWN
jgi:hypothetical protein